MSWVETIRLELLARDTVEQAHAEVIESYRRLAQQTAVLTARNSALLQATLASKGSSTPASALGTVENPVRTAFLNSLEAQLAQTRTELSEQYKIQSSNAQRLLALTDNLREVEDRGREDRDELGKLRREVEGLRERAKWHKEVVSEKERQLIILQDDHASLTLELNQLHLQNEDLKTDNSSLLQRWIEAKNDEASRMNEANTWMEKASKPIVSP